MENNIKNLLKITFLYSLIVVSLAFNCDSKVKKEVVKCKSSFVPNEKFENIKSTIKESIDKVEKKNKEEPIIGKEFSLPETKESRIPTPTTERPRTPIKESRIPTPTTERPRTPIKRNNFV